LKETQVREAAYQDREEVLRSEIQSVKNELKAKIAEAAKPQERLSENEQLVAKLKTEVEKLQKEILKLRGLEREIADLKGEKSKLESAGKGLKTQGEAQEKRAEELQAQLRQSLDAKENERKELEAALRQAAQERDASSETVESLKLETRHLSQKVLELEKELSMTFSLEKDANVKLAKVKTELETLKVAQAAEEEKLRL
jgi:chromosome segregation ATPase